jgi:very-short-patch-repair endonuclease
VLAPHKNQPTQHFSNKPLTLALSPFVPKVERVYITHMPRNANLVLARKLRREAPPAEQILWRELKHLRTQGLTFRRQHPIGLYVVDFINIPKQLIIELDGASHDTPTAQQQDAARSAFLQTHGYTVLRFTNTDVYENTSGVIETIITAIHV